MSNVVEVPAGLVQSWLLGSPTRGADIPCETPTGDHPPDDEWQVHSEGEEISRGVHRIVKRYRCPECGLVVEE